MPRLWTADAAKQAGIVRRLLELFAGVLGRLRRGARRLGDAVLFGQVHRLTVDSYALQHAAGRHPDKSLAIHPSGLYLMLKHRVRPVNVPELFPSSHR